MAFTLDDARAYVAEFRWQYAKTMPQWPHEYTVREWRQDGEREFSEFVALIRRDGIVKPWPPDAPTPRYQHTYLALDGWEYWTMGASVRKRPPQGAGARSYRDRRRRLSHLSLRPGAHARGALDRRLFRRWRRSSRSAHRSAATSRRRT